MQAFSQIVNKVSGVIFGTTEDQSSGSVKAVPARRTKRKRADSSNSKSELSISRRKIKPLKKPPAPTTKSAGKKYKSDSSASGSSSYEDERPQAKQPSSNKRKVKTLSPIRGKPPAPVDSSSEFSESADSRSERACSNSGFSSSEDGNSEPKPPVKKKRRVKTEPTKRRKLAAPKESSAKYARHHSKSDDSDSEQSSPESEVTTRAIKGKKAVDVTSSSVESENSSSEVKKPKSKTSPAKKRKVKAPRAKKKTVVDVTPSSVESESSSPEGKKSKSKTPPAKKRKVKAPRAKKKKVVDVTPSSVKSESSSPEGKKSKSKTPPAKKRKVKAPRAKKKKVVDMTPSSVKSESSSPEGKKPKSKLSPAKKRTEKASKAKQEKTVPLKHTAEKIRDSSPVIISSDSSDHEQELDYSQVFTSEVPDHPHKKQRIISQKNSIKLVNVRISMRAVELDRLAPKREIDDSLITLAFALLTQRQNQCAMPVACLFKSAIFFTASVRVTRGHTINTSPYERIFFPVHLPEYRHWILLVVDKDRHAIYCVDSLRNNHGIAEAEILRLWLTEFANDHCDFHNFQIYQLNPPGQGTNDCGPALIWAADQLSKNKEIQLPRLNGPATYKQYRKDIRKTLIHYCTLRDIGEPTLSGSNEDSDCMIVEYPS